MVPILSAGKTLIKTAIGPEQQSLTDRRLRRFIFVFRLWRFRRRHSPGLDRQRVTIRMNFFGKIFAEIFAAVIRHEERELEQINALIVRRIDPDLAEVKRAGIHRTHPRPMLAAIFRSKNAAALASQIAEGP